MATVVDGITRNPLVADYSEWKARDYFDTYYSEVVLPDEQAVLAYQIDVLRAARARFGRGLEYGCGPTLHRAVAAAKYAFRIDMADWLADNLAEAREWLCADGSAPEWNRFTRYVLACEGHARPDNERIAKREAQTRKVVRGNVGAGQRPRHRRRRRPDDLVSQGDRGQQYPRREPTRAALPGGLCADTANRVVLGEAPGSRHGDHG